MSTVLAAARYECRMQLRKRAVWVVTALVGVLLLAGKIPHWDPANTLAGDVGIYAELFNILVPVIFGGLLADRVVRDRRLGVAELLDSLPASPTARAWGKYLGSVTACVVPVLAVWLIALTRYAITGHTWRVVPLGLAAFAVIELPALLFAAAFALTCPTVLGPPLFRVLFVGYWFWGNLVTAKVMPTLSGTWLTPLGDYARVALLGGGAFADAHSYAGVHQSTAAGVGSIVVLLALAAAALTTWTILSARTRARS